MVCSSVTAPGTPSSVRPPSTTWGRWSAQNIPSRFSAFASDTSCSRWSSERRPSRWSEYLVLRRLLQLCSSSVSSNTFQDKIFNCAPRTQQCLCVLHHIVDWSRSQCWWIDPQFNSHISWETLHSHLHLIFAAISEALQQCGVDQAMHWFVQWAVRVTFDLILSILLMCTHSCSSPSL